MNFSAADLSRRLGDEGFEHLALVIDRSPQVVEVAVYLHLDFVEMPPPLGHLAHVRAALAPDLRGEHRAEPVPPIAHRLMAEVITTSRITSGEELKYRNGEGGCFGRAIRSAYRSALTGWCIWSDRARGTHV